MFKRLLCGKDWRLGYCPDADVFVGLVGGDRWAIELTYQELQDFCRLSNQIAETMIAMKSELSDQENLSCVAESEYIHLMAVGLPESFSLHLSLHNGRRAEGEWSPEVVPELLNAMKNLI